ncbi:MAG: alpha/beta fold hydrolase [Flavobacteriales bacterium]|nr:alpha/beta fold hydrolase [Flavobacteriales bacterium]
MSASKSHLVRVREGEGLLPVVCVHGDEANKLLPGHLDDKRPFYAFIHQGFGGTRVRLNRLETIARRFLKELSDAMIKPPFVLCGYSFGGLVAFEMAQQINKKSPDAVPLVALIDSYSPDLHVQAMKADQQFYVRVKNGIIKAALMPYLATDARMPGKLHHYHIISTYDKAVKAYTPKPFSGRLMVLKAQDAWGPDDLGWSSVAGGELDVYQVPADHFNIIKEPSIGFVAEALEQRIRAIELARPLAG